MVLVELFLAQAQKSQTRLWNVSDFFFILR